MQRQTSSRRLIACVLHGLNGKWMSLEFREKQQDVIAQINELIFNTSAGFFFSSTSRLELQGESSKLGKKEWRQNWREIRAWDMNSANVIQRQ